MLVILKAWAIWGRRGNIAKKLLSAFIVYTTVVVTVSIYGINVRGCESLLPSLCFTVGA